MESPTKRLLLFIAGLVLIGSIIFAILLITGIDMIATIQDSLFNPAVYLALLFFYSFLVAIILPLPIEIALFWPLLSGDMVYFAAATIVMAFGKTVGAWAVFYVGLKIEDDIRIWSQRIRLVETFVEWCTKFVKKTNYIGLFILLSIPLMSDTIPLYLYSLFNEEGKVLDLRKFAIVNFFAAIMRALILLSIWVLFKISLFG
jgi:membrane protein YqaA with SNARE-associated domain